MDTLDGKGVNENVGDGFNDIEKRQMDSGATEKYDNFDGHDYGADGSKGDCDENSHGGDYCDDGGVGCDDEDEVSEDGDEVSEDTDGGEVSDDGDDDNNGNNDGDDCDDDDLAWSPEFIDHAYKEHLDDNDEESQKKTRYMFI